MARAWGVFVVDRNGEALMVECFESDGLATRSDAQSYADEIRGDEAGLGNAVEVRAGTIRETSEGPMFVEALKRR